MCDIQITLREKFSVRVMYVHIKLGGTFQDLLGLLTL